MFRFTDTYMYCKEKKHESPFLQDPNIDKNKSTKRKADIERLSAITFAAQLVYHSGYKTRHSKAGR